MAHRSPVSRRSARKLSRQRHPAAVAAAAATNPAGRPVLAANGPVAAGQPVVARREGRPVLVAASTVFGLLGAALLVTGSLQVFNADRIDGLPVAQSGQYQIASHQGALSQQLVSGHTAAQPNPAAAAGAGTPTTTPANTEANRQAAATTQTASQLPNTVRLPHGGTAYLMHGEVSPDGSLTMPPGVNQAIWWGSQLNAQTGATVFAGHVNWAGVTGPFAELWQDKVGDIVTVRDTAGTLWLFRVTQVLTLSKSQVPQEAPSLFSPSGPHRVVLATCGGEWVGGVLGYADNRVLIATPVTS